MNDNIKDRMKLIMFEQKLSQAEFAKSMKMSPPSLNRMLNSDSEPSVGTLQKICETYNVNIAWLMSGKGPKYLKSEEELLVESEEDGDESKAIKFIQNTSSFQEMMLKIQSLEEENRRLRLYKNTTSYNPQTIAVTVNDRGEENIILVDSKAATSYSEKLFEPEFLSALPSFSLPSTRFRNGSFRAFEIQEDSMAKRINRGDWVICSRLDHFNTIRDAYVYVLVLEEDVVCKRVINRISERGRLRLKSDNPTYSDYEIEIEQVKEAWEVKSVMGFDLSNPDFELHEWIKRLEDDVFDLRDEMRKLKKGNSSIE